MASDKITFSAREMEVLALAWQCMETQPKIDMQKLANLTGYTLGSAGVTFGKIKTKLRVLGEGLAAAGPTTPKKSGTGGPGRSKTTTTTTTTTPKSTPGKRAVKAMAEANDGDTNDGAAETPSKKRKGGGAAGAASTARQIQYEDDDDEEEISAVRVKQELSGLSHGIENFYEKY